MRFVKRWATQLNTGGLLLIEETETILKKEPVFVRYLEVVEAMLESRSNRLYAGPIIPELGSSAGLRAELSETRMVRVTNDDAARMFALNMQVWKNGDFVRANYSRESIDELDTALRKIAEKESPVSGITWEMRQVAFCR